MTIKLLTPWNGIPALTRLTLDSGTEMGLVNAKQATTDLTGAIDYVPPKFKPYPVDVFQDPDTGQFVESDGSPLVSGGGNPIAYAALGTTSGAAIGERRKLSDGPDAGAEIVWSIPEGATTPTWCWAIYPLASYL